MSSFLSTTNTISVRWVSTKVSNITCSFFCVNCYFQRGGIVCLPDIFFLFFLWCLGKSMRQNRMNIWKPWVSKSLYWILKTVLLWVKLKIRPTQQRSGQWGIFAPAAISGKSFLKHLERCKGPHSAQSLGSPLREVSVQVIRKWLQRVNKPHHKG